MADAEKCSKCSETLDTTGYPLWCKVCRAKYRREYDGLRKEISETRGYAAGVTAMRGAIVAHFAKIGPFARLTPVEIAAMIRELPAPS